MRKTTKEGDLDMQIFWTDNFNRETVSERIVATGITDAKEAEAMLKGLRDTCTDNGSDWYRLAEDDVAPRQFIP